MTLVVVESARGQAMTPARAAWAEVARCDAHLAMHLSAALRRFGAAALGLVDLPAIELPSLDVDGADGADGVGVVSDVRPSAPELHVAAVLLWARHVEEGGLLELVAALAAAVATGSLPMTLGGETARKLVLLYRQRDEHFSLEERRALYQHLFADPVQRRLDALLEALTELGDAGPRESLVRPRARLALSCGAQRWRAAIGVAQIRQHLHHGAGERSPLLGRHLAVRGRLLEHAADVAAHGVEVGAVQGGESLRGDHRGAPVGWGAGAAVVVAAAVPQRPA